MFTRLIHPESACSDFCWRSWSLLMFAFGTFSLSIAQNSVPATDLPGKWEYQYYTESGKGGYRAEANYELTPAELTAFRKKIGDVVEFLHQNPLTKEPIGFKATVKGSIWTDMYEYRKHPVLWKQLSPQGEIILQFCPIYKNKTTGKLYENCIEVSHLDVLLNDLNSTTGGFNTYKKGNEFIRVFQSPVVYKTYAPGVVAYENGTVIISNPDRPYWIPLTIREYFELEIKFWEEQAVKDGNTYALDFAKRDYAAFTPEELDMTAYVGAQTNFSMILATTRPSDKKWMKLNLDYFDKTLPRNALQLITIHTLPDAVMQEFTPTLGNTDYGYHFRFTRQLNVTEMAKLLDVNKPK